jgi:hypothetical protein
VPNDLWSELDAFEADQDDQPAGERATDSASGSEPEDEGFLGSEMSLEAIAERGGPLADVAKELLAIRRERVDRQAAEKAAQAAEASIGAGRDLDDPAVQQELLALVVKRREEASRLFEAGIRQSLEAQGLSEEAVRDAMAVELEANRVAEAALGEPSVYELAEYRSFARARVERERARKTAIELRDRANLGYAAELEAAEADIDDALDRAISAP